MNSDAPRSRASTAAARSLSTTASTPSHPRTSIVVDRRAAASAGDHDHAALHERLNHAPLRASATGAGLPTTRRKRRARPASRRPSRSSSACTRASGNSVPDELRRVPQRRIVGVDTDLRDHGRDARDRCPRAATHSPATAGSCSRSTPPSPQRARRAEAESPPRVRARCAPARRRPAARCRARGTRFQPSSARSTMAPRLSRVCANCSLMVQCSPAGESALPPSAITAVSECSWLFPGSIEERAERVVSVAEGHPVSAAHRIRHARVQLLGRRAEISGRDWGGGFG